MSVVGLSGGFRNDRNVSAYGGEADLVGENFLDYAGVNSFGDGRSNLELHPTVKPVAVVADAIRDCSRRKGIVLDPFAGSGSTLIAG